ncbi:MAG: hypothetical protein OXC93_05225 [Rhodospirillaceae bacterium]|nr:hypothetical protein [Rhodospirillaceae bacterium]
MSFHDTIRQFPSRLDAPRLGMVVAALAAITIGGCTAHQNNSAAVPAPAATAAAATDWKRVKTLDEFSGSIVGKKLVTSISEQIFHADGTSTGTYKGYKVKGTWWWQTDTYCQEMGVVNRGSRRDCGRTIAVQDNKAHVTRGDGSKYIATIMQK